MHRGVTQKYFQSKQIHSEFAKSHFVITLDDVGLETFQKNCIYGTFPPMPIIMSECVFR